MRNMKMTKLYSLALLLGSTLAFVGCAGEEDDLFDQSAAERLNAAKSVYSARLTAAPAGWTMEYYPTYDTLGFKAKGYLMLAQFKNDGSVRMAMQNAFSQNKYLEDTSLWEIITDNGPELSFNSFNACLHAFSSPEDLPTSINDSGDNVQGLGAEGDYEFVLVDVKEGANEINIKGKKRGTYVHMVRLAEGTDFQQYLDGINTLTSNVFPNISDNRALMIMGVDSFVISNGYTGILEAYPYGGDPVTQTTHHAFVVTQQDGAYRLRFRNPWKLSDGLSTQVLAYDSLSQRFVGVDNASCVLKGYPSVISMEEKFASGYGYRILRQNKNRMSEKMYTVMNNLYKKMRNFANISLVKQDGVYYWRVQYSNIASYVFNTTFDAPNATYTFSYVQPKADETYAETIYTRYEELQELIKTLSQSFKVAGSASDYRLNQIRFTATDDPELWFDMDLF